jgi:DNA excision repair protein ERCC-4
MRILVDTREHSPFSFRGYEVRPEPATLPTGDYSLPGFEDRAAIERKSLDDLISCLMGNNRERFERELTRGRRYELFAIVVEAALSDVSRGNYKSEMKPHAAMQSIIAFQVRYGVPFLWCENRAGAEYYTYWLLSKYLREIEERYRLAMKNTKKTEKTPTLPRQESGRKSGARSMGAGPNN